MGHFQRLRVNILRRCPALRFFDIGYMFSMSIRPRVDRARRFLDLPGGVSYLIRRLFRPKLLRDIIHDAARHG